jgi:hypothetical protein
MPAPNDSALLRQLLDSYKTKRRHLVLMIFKDKFRGADTTEPEEWLAETRQTIADTEAELLDTLDGRHDQA